ncbi:MAG: hypothetical protein ABI267_06970, partial [Ginsengibacter sp.]
MPIPKKNFVFFIFTFFFAAISSAQSTIRNTYSSDTNIPHLKIERKIIYRPDTAWFYNHHASITHFKDKLVAVWSDGMKDEDQP